MSQDNPPGESADDCGQAARLAQDILTLLRQEPRHFVEVLKHFRAHDYRVLLLAWSRLREERRLGRDKLGKYVAV
jgi:hypothetical protein